MRENLFVILPLQHDSIYSFFISEASKTLSNVHYNCLVYKVCQRKLLNMGGEVARGYTSVGLMAPFYVFPCGHAFHGQCLIAHVTRCTTPAQAEHILDLQKQLTLPGSGSRVQLNGSFAEEETITNMAPMNKIQAQMDDAVGSECPFCGELMIREISLPFILPMESDEVESWEIN
ncbi:membrane trafficking regulatory protein [Lithospermum erythrorhizon]|uniref:Membrane trafficking regulatory protein n=1 Tax=Lithospermum erythrorhizon TaxID=34254 RepID=A0AAV3S3K5_LITER